MKHIFGPGLISGLSLILVLSAGGQTQSATPTPTNDAPAAAAADTAQNPVPTRPSLAIANAVHRDPQNSRYDYDFIQKGFVWSNKPLKATASKICSNMKDRGFAETAYAINGDQDWNSCLDTQITSIGYMRWLQNKGFKPTAKNRKKAQTYLKQTYTMGRFGSYTFPQLNEAFQNASQQHPEAQHP